MNLEIAAALSPAVTAAPAASGVPVQGGYGVSLTDFGNFQQSMLQAGMRLEARPAGGPTIEAARQLMKPFEHINGEAGRLSLDAKAADTAGRQMTPSEMVSLSMRCQEFSFHCQLMSNIANRTSDGLQQLFRQQS
jgi:hypothetical protein